MEIAKIIGYKFNGGKKARRRRNNNKRRRDPNNNQENYLRKTGYNTRSELGGYGSTTTGGTRSIFLAGILAES